MSAGSGTGRELVAQALERGHAVTAFVRSPNKMSGTNRQVRVITGHPTDPRQLAAALPGHDAVLSALGHSTLASRSTLLTDAAQSIVAAMRETAVRRLLAISQALLLPTAGFIHIISAVLGPTVFRNVLRDSRQMDRVVSSTDLDWTIVRPPRLTNGPRTGVYRVADGRLPSGGWSISRADLAQFMLEEVQNSGHVREVVGLCY